MPVEPGGQFAAGKETSLTSTLFPPNTLNRFQSHEGPHPWRRQRERFAPPTEGLRDQPDPCDLFVSRSRTTRCSALALSAVSVLASGGWITRTLCEGAPASYLPRPLHRARACEVRAVR